MPSKNMLPKGQRRVSVKAQYRAQRGVEPVEPVEVVPAEIESVGDLRNFNADVAAKDMRLDAYLAKAIPDISRARVQLLIEHEQVKVDGVIAKGKLKLRGGESIEIEGEPKPEPLHAIPEEIPLQIVYEDDDLAIVDKPAGMMVHAGAGATEDARSKGTLVNALLHHLNSLSEVGGELRPGIVHRLDRQTSGLIIVAKNDSAHRKLGEMFSERRVSKTYIALVHGWMAKDSGTVSAPIARDSIRRTRMTTKIPGGRTAISHWTVLERIDGPHGKFTLVEVKIETGRTHQIRVHMQSISHPVAGDTLYGAPRKIASILPGAEPVGLERNFLHAARLSFLHPRTSKEMKFEAPLPPELEAFLPLVGQLKPVAKPAAKKRAKR